MRRVYTTHSPSGEMTELPIATCLRVISGPNLGTTRDATDPAGVGAFATVHTWTLVLTVTEDAIEKILLVRDREDDAADLSLWIEVTGVDALGRFGYDLWLAPSSDAVDGDVVETHGGVVFTIPKASVEALRGATLDRQGDLATGGLVIQPAHPLGAGTEGGAPPAELDGDTAARVGMGARSPHQPGHCRPRRNCPTRPGRGHGGLSPAGWGVPGLRHGCGHTR